MANSGNGVSRRSIIKGALTGSASVALLGTFGRTALADDISGNIRVGWWGDNTRAQAAMAAFDKFRQAHPGLAISSEYTGFQNYVQKVTTQIAGGGAPDVFQCSRDNIGGFAQVGAIEDLGPLIKSGAIDVSAFDEGALDLCKVNGVQVALPFGLNAGMTIMDATRLGALGFKLPDGSWNWDDYGDLSLAISKKAGSGYWGTADGGGYRQTLETLVRQRGHAMFGADGQLGFTKEDLTDHFAYWKKLRDNGAAADPTEQAIFQDQIDGLPAVRGITAFDWTNSSIYNGIQALTKNRLEVTRLPIAASDNTGQSSQLALAFSIYSQTHSQAACAALLNYLVNDKEAIQTLGFAFGIFPSSRARDIVSSTLTADQKRLFGVDLLNLINTNPAKPVPLDPAGSSSILPLLRKTNEDISFNRATVAEGVNNFFSQAQRTLGG